MLLSDFQTPLLLSMLFVQPHECGLVEMRNSVKQEKELELFQRLVFLAV